MTNVFPLPLRVYPAAVDNTMDMWVETQVLTPGMQNTIALFQRQNASSRMNGAYSRPHQRANRNTFFAVQANGIQLVRHGKNHVVVFNRQGAVNQVVDPESLFCSLASGQRLSPQLL